MKKSIAEKIESAVGEDLRGIETALRENLTAHLDIVEQAASHILFSGGKRLRPLLFVLCARMCGYSGNNDKSVAAVFEYIHAASLLHDDLVDGASLRRGKPAAHSVWGNSIAVLVGDFLLARSLSVVLSAGKPEILESIAHITENLTQGEIHQLMRKGNIELTEEEYFEVIRRKTAVLIQGTCRSGAIMADAPEKSKNALSEYGLNLGLAFQMADDLLDFTADTDTLGKEIGADLREGKLTLPVIYSLNKASATDREWMAGILKSREFSVRDMTIFVEKLNKYEGLAYTKMRAETYVEKAKNALSVFESSKPRKILTAIADYVLKRKK